MEEYMKYAIELAKKGVGWVNPNPMVGAVIVKNDRIIASGYHHKFGDIHAEMNAINNASEDLNGSTMYVTLEPCCHYGKNPPCTEAIIRSGISKVVVGSIDPNPLVSGKGIKILKEAGIEVIDGFLKKECDDINEIFFYYVRNNKPYVVMKFGMTLDGKISTNTGLSRWITSEQSRIDVHKKRHKYMSIMVGINTVLDDNPMLDCRIDNMKNPIRIICDTSLKIPLESKIVQSSNQIKTIIVTKSLDLEKISKLESYGCVIIQQKSQNNKDEKIDIEQLMFGLHDMGIDSVYLEGGASLNWSMIERGMVDEIHTYISPKIFGGKKTISPIEGYGIDNINDCKKLEFKSIQTFGEDLFIVSKVIK